jgi:hypothetical protein
MLTEVERPGPTAQDLVLLKDATKIDIDDL